MEMTSCNKFPFEFTFDFSKTNFIYTFPFQFEYPTNAFPLTFPFQFPEDEFPYGFPLRFSSDVFPYTFPFQFPYCEYTRHFEQLFQMTPKFMKHNEQLFQIYIHWREPQDQLFSVNVNYPDPYFTSKGAIRDILINILKLLKDSWSLTETNVNFPYTFPFHLQSFPGLGASSIAFSTGWYNESIAMPQITITPLASTKGVLSCGSDPLYGYTNYVNVDIWVRPLQDSGRSIGQAKWAEYNIRREVERILRSGSRIGSQYNNEEFIYFGKRSHRDEIDKRPVIFRTTIQVIDNLFRETYGDE